VCGSQAAAIAAWVDAAVHWELLRG